MADEVQITSEREANANEWQADRRIYLDKDGNVVEHNDPNKLSLLVAEGGFLSLEDAEKHGLVTKGKKGAKAKAEEKSVEKPADKPAPAKKK